MIWIRLLDAYLDRELDEAESASVRDHLGACATCRQQVADRESLGRLIRRAPYYTAPARLKAQAPTFADTGTWPLRAPFAWAAAALLVASLTGSMLLWSRSARTANSVDTVAEAIVDIMYVR